MAARAAWLVFLILALSCDRETPAGAKGAASAGTADATAPPMASVMASATQEADGEELETVDDTADNPHEDACAPKDPALKPMQLLSFALADGIENKDPKRRVTVARASQRIYAHLRMRNRSGRKRCVVVSFVIGGDERTRVTLQVGKSWNWRTWAYATPRSDDRGPLVVRVTDDQGAIIVEKTVAVVPAGS